MEGVKKKKKKEKRRGGELEWSRKMGRGTVRGGGVKRGGTQIRNDGSRVGREKKMVNEAIRWRAEGRGSEERATSCFYDQLQLRLVYPVVF